MAYAVTVEDSLSQQRSNLSVAQLILRAESCLRISRARHRPSAAFLKKLLHQKTFILLRSATVIKINFHIFLLKTLYFMSKMMYN
jgi:hypothetical protein